MENSSNNTSVIFIVRAFMAVCSAILVAMVTWIAVNINDVPVIKNQISNISQQIASQNTESNARLTDHETRLRVIESKVKP